MTGDKAAHERSPWLSSDHEFSGISAADFDLALKDWLAGMRDTEAGEAGGLGLCIPFLPAGAGIQAGAFSGALGGALVPALTY